MDYSLTGSSPCIDTGDPSSSLDPDSTRADMGALYFDQRYRILNFHLVGPTGDSVYLNPPKQFVWRSTTDIDSGYQMFYKFFIDDNSQFSSPDSSGILSDTVYVLPDSLNRSQSYFWRVLAFNYHAVPIYSNETWGFYVDGFPSAPSVLGPANGYEADSATYLSWLLGSDPDPMDTVTYTLQVDNDPAFSSPEIEVSGITESGLAVDEAVAVMLSDLPGLGNLQWGGSYYWRVRSDDKFGLSSSFTDGTNWFSMGFDANDPPYPPTGGFSPANGEEVISLAPLITWNDADDPDPTDNGDNISYAIRLSRDSLFSGFVYYDTTAPGINQIQPASELDDNSHYFYCVRSIDDGGLPSGWSTRQNFWTNHYNFPPEPFPLFAPYNGQKQVVYYTHFSWGNTVDYDPNSSFTFSVEYSPDSLFRYDVGVISNLPDTATSIVTDSLALSGLIYWRILAIDDDGLSRTGGLPEGPRSLLIIPPGDANTNGVTNGIDATFMVAYLKGQGAAPDPIQAGDANGNCTTNGIDVVYLVAYLKGIGAPPVRPDCEEIILSTKGGINEAR